MNPNARTVDTLSQTITLNHDILTYLLPFLASSPSTLATLCLLSKSVNPTATRALYHSITLAGSPTTYQLLFATHCSSSPSTPRPSPCTHTRHLTLSRHFLPLDTSPYVPSSCPTPPSVTSLYAPLYSPSGTQLSDLSLPPIPSFLFPHLTSLTLDVHRTHLASIFPILITLDPVSLFIGPQEPLDSPSETASAYLPHRVFEGYTRLEKVVIRSTDLHPPDESDYPPYGEFPFPRTLPALREVQWVYQAEELERGFGRGFFQNLVGLFGEREGEEGMEVGVTILREEENEELDGGTRDASAKAWENLVSSLEEAAADAGLDMVEEEEVVGDADGKEEGQVWSVGQRVRVRLRMGGTER